jgi:prepilin-type N-terminal cleavage/methylation domain-containing protein
MHDQTPANGKGQQGFTLIEAMVAMVILIFGVAAVANLMVVAGTSNTVANHTTAAASAATQQMELLKSTTYTALVTGGDISGTSAILGAGDCGTVAVNAFRCATRMSGANGPDYAGVGTIYVRWQVGPAVAVGSTTTRVIRVAAESMAPAIRPRSRVLLTTFRTDNP